MASLPEFTPIPHVRTDAESVLSPFAIHDRFLRALFDDAPYGVFITRPDGRVAACNQHVADMLGHSHDEIIGRHFNDFTVLEDRSIGLGAIQAILAGDESYTTLEKRYVRRNGEILWVHLNIG